jgi:hypothetical protein
MISTNQKIRLLYSICAQTQTPEQWDRAHTELLDLGRQPETAPAVRRAVHVAGLRAEVARRGQR